MNDAQRGTVWEESIVATPADVRIVALSATLSNAPQIAGWLRRVRGRAESRPIRETLRIGVLRSEL